MDKIILILQAALEIISLIQSFAGRKGVLVTDLKVSDLLAEVKDLPLFLEGLDEASAGIEKIRKSFEEVE